MYRYMHTNRGLCKGEIGTGFRRFERGSKKNRYNKMVWKCGQWENTRKGKQRTFRYDPKGGMGLRVIGILTTVLEDTVEEETEEDAEDGGG